MNTEQTVVEKLQPLPEVEVRPDFVEAIQRPTALVKPDRKEKLRNLLEERFFLGEFGLAIGGFAALFLTGDVSRLETYLAALLAALASARILTALVDRQVFLRVGPSLVAGAASCFLTWFLLQSYFLLRYWSGLDDLSRPVEWLKVMAIVEPVRAVELLVFSGGVAALCTFLVRDRLNARPWISGRLHSAGGRKAWKFGAAGIGILFLASAFSAPSPQRRCAPSDSYNPLAQLVNGAIYRGDIENLERVLRRYPAALDWFWGQERVTNSVRSVQMARYLVEKHKVSFAAPQGPWETALYEAVKSKNDPLAEYLLAHGADPNEGKYLPLVEAVKQRRPYAIHFLLEHGADPNARSTGDGTALEIADKMAEDDIWLILQQKR